MIDRNSKTYGNLQSAFDMDCISYAKYIIFARKAGREGFAQIRDAFYQAAQNKLAHAEIWKGLLDGIRCSDTQNNLSFAVNTGYSCTEQIYTIFTKTAFTEGYFNTAEKFKMAANVEKEHKELFSGFLQAMEKAELFCRDTRHIWECTVCGHQTTGYTAPEYCGLCGASQTYIIAKRVE